MQTAAGGLILRRNNDEEVGNWMNVRSKVKTNARRAVTQNYIKTLCVTLIILCVSTLFAVFVVMANTFAEMFASRMTHPIYVLGEWNYLYSPIVVAVSLVFEWFLFSPLILGAAKWFYRLSGGDSGDVIDLFDFFSGARRYFSSLWMELHLFVRRFIYSFLFFIVPGAVMVCGAALLDGRWSASDPISTLVGTMLLIAGSVLTAAAGIFAWVFLKRYALARYLFAEGECTVRQAIRQSVYFMKGRKGELFLFDLSFIGWFISCILVVPAFYVAPYYLCANALYARVMIEHGQRGVQTEQQAEPTREFDSETDADIGFQTPSNNPEDSENGTAF